MNHNLLICAAIAASPLLLSCVGASKAASSSSSSSSQQLVQPQPEPLPAQIADSKPVSATLKASIFRMSGDYGDKVAVTLGADGNLIYFPAPSDLTAESAPVQIGEGWWLNRQGLGPNSVFTTYTFEEYRKLKSVPTPEEIKKAIIPGAKVTAFERLSISASEAIADPSALKKFLPRR